MRKRISFYFLLSLLVVKIFALNEIKQLDSDPTWKEAVRLTRIESNIETKESYLDNYHL